MEKILVLGIGNVLMGDEGVGIHAINRLEKLDFPENVVLLDGGTGGFHLLSYLEDYPKVIMIDATIDGQLPGAVILLYPKFSKDFPIALSAHDIGLKDLIDAASIRGNLPEIFLITVSIAGLDSISMQLSPEVERSLPEIEKMVFQIIDKINEEKVIAKT